MINPFRVVPGRKASGNGEKEVILSLPSNPKAIYRGMLEA